MPPLLSTFARRSFVSSFHGLKRGSCQFAKPRSFIWQQTSKKHSTLNVNQITRTNPPPRSVKWWITGCTVMVYGIIIVGGITRLTESGLSMVEWKFQGSLPPLNQNEWEDEFGKYKQYPEFKRLCPNMTLEEFKNIYFWEYLHRMWGRAIGLAVAIPFTYFAVTKKIQGPLLTRCGLVLGGVVCQGLIGWWMVKSGLEEPDKASTQPRVSQYRLATHLSAALGLYSLLFWTSLDLWNDRVFAAKIQPSSILTRLPRVRLYAAGIFGLVFTTAFSGAIVAGLDAGLAYNMFPLMEEGRIKAENAWNVNLVQYFPNIHAWFKDNLFENTASVQFNHRVLAITSATLISAFYLTTKQMFLELPKSARYARHSLMFAVGMQVALGISTLLYLVPVPLAACHQAGSVAVLSAALWLWHSLKRVKVTRLIK